MSDTANIEREFKHKVCDQLEIVSEGLDRYLIITPLAFDDGDLLPIVLRREENRWLLSDEGHTFMQLGYKLDDVDLNQGTRGEIIAKTLSSFQMENRKGELVLPIPGEKFGDSLYSFVQALLKIDDVRYLSRERVRSTFFEDFRTLMENLVSTERRTFDWREVHRDPDGKYQVDCRINGSKTPLFVFALPSDERVQIATISLLTFEKWNLSHRSLGIFEEQERINPKTLARFADVCEKTFSNLSVAGDRFPRYFSELGTSAA
jgi:hypothetical protein